MSDQERSKRGRERLKSGQEQLKTGQERAKRGQEQPESDKGKVVMNIMNLGATVLFSHKLALWVLKLPSANTRGIAGYKIQNPAARSSPGGSPGCSPASCCAQE